MEQNQRSCGHVYGCVSIQIARIDLIPILTIQNRLSRFNLVVFLTYFTSIWRASLSFIFLFVVSEPDMVPDSVFDDFGRF